MFTTNNRGRYKCDFCSRPSYKTRSGIDTHLKVSHLEEMVDSLKNQLAQERNKAPKEKIVTKERVVYRDKPEPKYWYPARSGTTGVYCTTCRQVNLNVGIPRGQLIENTPHNNCGNETLLPVMEVR